MSEIAVDELATRLGEVLVLDVRSPQEYDGSAGQHCDPRQGHIPGARNLDIYRLLELTTDEVHAQLGLEAGAEVVAYCHSGSRSALATQVLRSLGYDARNYAGSWHEWSRHDELPVEA
ncbi:MAG: thiosulfate/3-mercaptopyruvate sulfurtransferase [Gaiellaceae bacterium]|nr:thiosulfate/3-mercaptopyruvate sulfurtransferase [Gaiellaceae bacterium]